jgi:enoyl-CoA hydratase
MGDAVRAADYRALKVAVSPAGVLEIRIGGIERPSVLDREAHTELARIWADADRDPLVRAVLVRGVGKDLSTGGDLALIQRMTEDFETRRALLTEAREIVRGIIDFTKPVVSMLHGRCIGAGLVPALLADISIAADDAVIMDGHTRVGLVAGDHAVAIWPLLCGMARAKRLLLLNDPVSGAEAASIGLVSQSVDASILEATAEETANRLAAAAPTAVRWTKHALNQWLRQAEPAFELSLALQFVGVTGPEVQEGLAAIHARRAPSF